MFEVHEIRKKTLFFNHYEKSFLVSVKMRTVFCCLKTYTYKFFFDQDSTFTKKLKSSRPIL